MRLFILYNLQLEIINFLYKNLRKAEWYQNKKHGTTTRKTQRSTKRSVE
jgi:hypothetical protein